MSNLFNSREGKQTGTNPKTEYNGLRFNPSVPQVIQEEISNPSIRSYQDTDYTYLDIWMKDLAQFYDGHTEQNKLLDQLIGAEKADKSGYFTKSKHMYIVQNEEGLPLGMICINNKRGGAAKIGPVVVDPEARGRGIGKALFQTADEVASAGGSRKLYATTSHLNVKVNKLFESNGFKIEAEFPDQYKKGSLEYIWGKHIEKPKLHIDTVESVKLEESDGTRINDIRVQSFTQNDLIFLEEVNYIHQQWHDELGSDFVEGMISGHNRGLSFQEKGKVILLAKAGNNPQGMVTFTPKRGGPTKLYPLSGTADAQLKLIEEARKYAIEIGSHKFYTFVHISDLAQQELLLAVGFEKRGVLQSPYKSGHDLVAMDMFV